MSIDYSPERYVFITKARSLRRERFLPESKPANPGDASADSNEESKIIYPLSCLPMGALSRALDYLRDIFLKFPRLEQQTWGKTRGPDLEKASEFQFKKKRMIFLQLLDKGPHAAKGLTADLARSVREAALSQTDEKGILAIVEKFSKEDRGTRIRMPSFLKSSSGEEGLWESAKNRASSISNSQFLSELKTIPEDQYLHDVAIDVERTAYDILTKHVDTSVSSICRQILSTQKQDSDKQVQKEADSKEAEQVQALWSKFVHQVKRISTQRFESYVPLCGVHIGLTTDQCAGVQLSIWTTSKSESRPWAEVCLTNLVILGVTHSLQQKLSISEAVKNLNVKMR